MRLIIAGIVELVWLFVGMVLIIMITAEALVAGIGTLLQRFSKWNFRQYHERTSPWFQDGLTSAREQRRHEYDRLLIQLKIRQIAKALHRAEKTLL